MLIAPVLPAWEAPHLFGWRGFGRWIGTPVTLLEQVIKDSAAVKLNSPHTTVQDQDHLQADRRDVESDRWAVARSWAVPRSK